MATHLDRKSTCTVIETNMVILFGAYLAYFSLTNQSREVTCDFDFASGAGDDCDGWNFDDHDFLKIIYRYCYQALFDLLFATIVLVIF